MSRAPLPSTLAPFDWEAAPSGTDAYWQFTWDLVAEQKERLAHYGIVPRDPFGGEGTLWAPAVDLELGRVETGQEPYVAMRPIWGVATATTPADPPRWGFLRKTERVRLFAGTPLRLVARIPDLTDTGLGANVWRLSRRRLGRAPFIHSAREGRWGGAAVLGDCLILPFEHPLLGNAARADRLVRDLQEITLSFRARHARTGWRYFGRP